MLGAEPKKVNPKTMAMFDSILQQMVRHGGPVEGSAGGAGAKPASRERADSDKDRARPKGDKSTSGNGGPGSLRGKAVPVLPVAVAAGSASPAAGDASGEVPTVPVAELLKSPRRRPPPSPSTPTVAPDAVHVQFSEPDPATGNRCDNPPAQTCLPAACVYILHS